MSKESQVVSSQTIRASVSFPEEDYRELERIAKQKRVSVAWVVRDAVKAYLDKESPLFRRSK
jgi:metal-responsive CopG/Arc/MetJ family transcriptional regulator